jgi:hypothetical protein
VIDILLACVEFEQLKESDGAVKSLTSRLHTALREGAHLRQRVEQLEADTSVSSSPRPPLTALSADARLYVSGFFVRNFFFCSCCFTAKQLLFLDPSILNCEAR